jgi:hypothetical protein
MQRNLGRDSHNGTCWLAGWPPAWSRDEPRPLDGPSFDAPRICIVQYTQDSLGLAFIHMYFLYANDIDTVQYSTVLYGVQ